MDFKEFQAFGRTNPVFLAVGHRMQTKLRHKLFGRQYWIDQTKKRRDRYAFDKKFESDMEKYVSLRYGDMPPVERKSRASFGSRTATPATPKKKEAAVDFWGEFPEVYQQVLAQIKREEGEKATLAALHRTMRAELHGKLIKAVETLFGDARSLEGCFSRWKARCVQQRRLLRDVDSATGTETTELDVDDAVHAGIIETMNRTRSSHEVRDATLLKAHDIATMKRTKRSRLTAAQYGTLRGALGDHSIIEDGVGWRERESIVSIQRSSSLKSRSRIRSYYDDGDTSDEESAASFLYDDEGSVVSKLTL